MKEQKKYPLLVDKVTLKLLNTREIKNCSLNKPYQILAGGNRTIQICFLKSKVLAYHYSNCRIFEIPLPQKKKKKMTTQPLVYNSFHSFCVLLYGSYLNPVFHLILTFSMLL